MKKNMKKNIKKPIKDNKITGSINTKFLPENIKETISKYFYYKGYINGLEKAKELKENEINALIDVYSIQTKYIDNLLEWEFEK